MSKIDGKIDANSALSGREKQILGMLQAGLPNQKFARELRLTPKTVANHLTSVFKKLGVSNRYEAVVHFHDSKAT